MILYLLLGCMPEVGKEECEELCDQLVQECEYGAYPTYESCEQGCVYEESQGGDTRGLLQCMNKAGCDTFAIIECEHTFGVGTESEE